MCKCFEGIIYLDMPKVSIVILNYNGHRFIGELLVKCIESVLLTNYPSFEVLFVDNASMDDSLDIVKSRFGSDERLRFIQNSENLGFAEGNNVGLKFAQGDYIALLNNDTIVDPDWLKNLVDVIKLPAVGAVQSKLLLMSNPNLMDCAGGFLDYYGYPFERHHGKDASLCTQVSESFYGKGASLLLKRDALKKSGVFDKDLFIYYDETDLCWRLRLAGYKIVFAPSSIVYHASNATSSKVYYNQQIDFFFRRNHLMVMIKNFNTCNMFRYVSIAVICEIKESILLYLKRKPHVSQTIFKAIFWNLINLKNTWKKRVNVQNLVRQVSDKEIKQFMLKPSPPFPLLLFPKAHTYKRRSDF